MIHPGEHANVSLEDGAKPFVGVGAVAGNRHGELRDKPGMIEDLFTFD